MGQCMKYYIYRKERGKNNLFGEFQSELFYFFNLKISKFVLKNVKLIRFFMLQIYFLNLNAKKTKKYVKKN